MIESYDCCVIGDGLLARLWAAQLSQHGRKTMVISNEQRVSSAPPYLALTLQSVATLQRFNLEVPGVAIDYLSLYQGVNQRLQRWGRGLGLHVARADLEQQLLPTPCDAIKGPILSLRHDGQRFEIRTENSPTIYARFCFDFSGLSSPLRLLWQRPFSSLTLQAFQARVFQGQFDALEAHTAYQFKTGTSLWAFLPLAHGEHYVVQTWPSQHDRPAYDPIPLSGPATLLCRIAPQPIASIKNPYGRFGALLGSSAYMGHPNVASTFNVGLWQLELMQSFLLDQKEELLLVDDLNHVFSAKVWWLEQVSQLLASPIRPFLALSPSFVSQLFIESLS